jgi:hypothetical protein
MVKGYINSVLRLSRLSFVRALAALAIAIASPAVEVGHGLAHEHEHEHAQETSHHDDRTVSVADHAPDHPHERISEALRNRGDVTEFVPLPAVHAVVELPAASFSLPIPVSDTRRSGDRSTGPPPSLRAPPID